MSAKALPPH
ncbi:hypothetical protein Q9966_016232 [Columba livia]|nr:hypothetical protein Q9966_016232 [Columba livia]